MASILDRYGIKEVADVIFYTIKADGTPGVPQLYLDTLKVSTSEQTAETTDATGGKGNSPLISWDYGKDINVALEDALFSTKSMAIMYGAVNKDGEVQINEVTTLRKTEQMIASGGKITPPTKSIQHTINGQKVMLTDTEVVVYDEEGKTVADPSQDLVDGNKYFVTYEIKVAGSEIVISAAQFPGTYYVTGETFARSEKTGRDEYFQFIIPKAKVLSENTLTMEAEGDPTVFSMNLKVLRPADGKMMKLIKYDFVGE